MESTLGFWKNKLGFLEDDGCVVFVLCCAKARVSGLLGFLGCGHGVCWAVSVCWVCGFSAAMAFFGLVGFPVAVAFSAISLWSWLGFLHFE